MTLPVSRDLDLPQWGPYNKKYDGFSHIAHPEQGLRFDVDVFPGFYRRGIMNTKAIADSGARLWNARPDLKHFVIRYELTPEICCQANFFQEDRQLTARFDFVNGTADPQSLQLDLCCSIRLPTYENRPITASETSLPPDRWINAQEYSSVHGTRRIPRDGLRLGECFCPGAIGGAGVDTGLLDETGKLTYHLPETRTVTLRYQAPAGAWVRLNGADHFLPVSHHWILYPVAFPEPITALTLESCGSRLILDGIAMGSAGAEDFRELPQVYVPRITAEGNRLTLNYPGIPQPYTIVWEGAESVVRELTGRHDDMILTDHIHNHTRTVLSGDGEGHYTDLFLRPLFLAPGESKTVTVHFLAGSGPVRTLTPLPLPEFTPNPSGRSDTLSRQLLAAAVQVNVVWPTYFRGQWMKHSTPGKVWDSFYTWDSGMIALGLLSLDEERAIQCLNTYLSPLDDPHTPFIKHGTPLLTQVFAFQELVNLGKTDICREFYPRLRRSWEHLLNSCSPFSTGLLNTWNLFYNSGGWDDYPPQQAVHRQNLASVCAPAIATSFAILVAKILSSAAEVLGFESDLPGYQARIHRLGEALQHSWDPDTGYFGYALHDASGAFTGLLRTPDGPQMNMGLDGIYPLIAGEGSPEQTCAMLRNLEEGLLTPVGVSAVDLRSPYFSDSGYWNGSVWMPHQWILWKALLDQNQPELANRIALTAMEVWRGETERTHNCYEHFMLRNGRGAGFHHFSGLSSPVLRWFDAYYLPGQLHTGFLTRIDSAQWAPDCTGGSFTVTAPSPSAAVITLAPGTEYQFRGATAQKLWEGTYSLSLSPGTGNITILPK